jgi:N4-gp56 family major capsid protein
VVCGLRMRLVGEGVQGDATLEGQEEALTTYSDTLVINQLRHATRSAGKMSEQRVPFDVRQDNLEGLRDWWSERFDQSFANQVAAFTAQTDTRFTGNNAAVAADTDHLIRAGGVANDESLTSGNKFDLSLIDACVARAKTYFENGIPIIRPLRVDGEDKYVMFLHPYQVRDMRTNASNGAVARYPEGRNGRWRPRQEPDLHRRSWRIQRRGAA